ncbi:alpha/beta-hydrolase [Lindgomyces ingoldianus]|uniref:Alpha/beta-hydrolase n=1 Tax=Lindgomyces ingoldianus TaxID=673940 RepID=A0ACB6R8C3_9PLEO|nr:alpha/beta-hydrolase [Lindgomyces ingoldianus]KAF2475000.1 alpha/beta-hydrolase [Lindgomyces ingoldianus]
MVQVGNWLFSPLVQSFPQTVIPNAQVWSVTSNVTDLKYQIEVAWPLEWSSRNTNSTVETMYILDGNALGFGATEAFRRRRPVEFNQPDTIVVSIGYPISDSPYSAQRSIDFQPPWCLNCTAPSAPGVRSGAEDFIKFIDKTLRPWVKQSVFPAVNFHRDAIYGHSFGGLFTLYALISHPTLFDTFLSASPALFWNNGYILTNLTLLNTHNLSKKQKPAYQISYGAIEQFPVKRRTETQADFDFRKSILESMKMTDNCNALYNGLKTSSKLRDVQLHAYPFSDHAAVGGAAISDGIDYFLDW